MEQVREMLQQFRTNTPPAFVSPPKPSTDDDPYTLIRLEQAATTGLTVQFDGNPANFPAWLKKFRDYAVHQRSLNCIQVGKH